MDALRQREAEMVREWAPKFERLYQNVLVDRKARPKNPTTIAELLDPLVHLMEQAAVPPDGETNKGEAK